MAGKDSLVIYVFVEASSSTDSPTMGSLYETGIHVQENLLVDSYNILQELLGTVWMDIWSTHSSQ